MEPVQFELVHRPFDVLEWLAKKNACFPSRQWVSGRKDKTVEGLWNACEVGEWMLWAGFSVDAFSYVKEQVDEIAAAAISRALLPLSEYLTDIGIENGFADLQFRDQNKCREEVRKLYLIDLSAALPEDLRERTETVRVLTDRALYWYRTADYPRTLNVIAALTLYISYGSAEAVDKESKQQADDCRPLLSFVLAAIAKLD